MKLYSDLMRFGWTSVIESVGFLCILMHQSGEWLEQFGSQNYILNRKVFLNKYSASFCVGRFTHECVYFSRVTFKGRAPPALSLCMCPTRIQIPHFKFMINKLGTNLMLCPVVTKYDN